MQAGEGRCGRGSDRGCEQQGSAGGTAAAAHLQHAAAAAAQPRGRKRPKQH